MRFVKTFIFALLPAVILFICAEGILWFFGFQYSKTPMEVRAQEVKGLGAVSDFVRWNNRKGVKYCKKDPYQLWVPVEEFAQGYSKEKPQDVFRIVTLGCSCTMMCVGGDATYPSAMEEYLNTQSGRKVEVINAAVAGYSSYQGLQRLKHVVLDYKPDMITVFFGWNDHWTASREDKDVKIHDPWVIDVVNFAEQFRTYQFLNFTISRLFEKGSDILYEEVLRVNPVDYEKNLNAMIDIARQNNIKVALLTAPYDLSHYKPASIFRSPREKLIEIHSRYNDIVRLTAHKRGVFLVDLADFVKEQPQQSVLAQDGIHFSAEGCVKIGKAISYALLAQGVF